MSNLTQQFNQSEMSNTDYEKTGNTLAQSNASREIEEVKGQIFMAKQFPRNIFQAEQRILDNCKRLSLAEGAVYSYPRGGSKVEGPSIRLAEVLAQNWGNLSFGIKELEQKNGESVALAYAWDLETNVREEKVFTVPHTRHSKKGITKLTDPRDIYETVANNGARRLRACILGIIPGDIVDKAVEQCNQTMSGSSEAPLKDRISQMLTGFKENYGVTQAQIEARAGYNIGAFTPFDLNNFKKIFNSLKNGMSKPEDWFEKGQKEQSKLAAGLNEEAKKEDTAPQEEVRPDAAESE